MINIFMNSLQIIDTNNIFNGSASAESLKCTVIQYQATAFVRKFCIVSKQRSSNKSVEKKKLNLSKQNLESGES